MIVGLTLLYFALTCALILGKLNAHKKVSYRLIQTGIVYYRLQVSPGHSSNHELAMLTLQASVVQCKEMSTLPEQ